MSRALWAGVTGLTSNAFKLDVIGNNIANMQTTGFKSSRALFGDLLSQTINGGTAAVSGGSAGVNPTQVGTGVRVVGVDMDFTQGAFLTTGNVTDVAISGSGFFILNNGDDVRYTRDGAFSVDVDGTLVSPFNGYHVQGWQAVDGVVNNAGVIGDIDIPLGTDTIATATSALTLVGNLDSSDTDDAIGTNAFSGGIIDSLTAAAATGAALLTNLQDSGANNLVLENGDYLTVTASKGSGTITTRTFTVGTTGTTLSDFADFIEDTYGIVSDTNTAANEGVRVSGGMIALQGNIGTSNALTAITISGTDVAGGNMDTAVFGAIFGPDLINGFNESVAASGESSFTQMIVYDSLGVSHTVDVIYSRADASADTWSFFAVGDDNFLAGTRGTELLTTAGVLQFSTAGAVQSFTGDTMTINLQNGATTPQQMTVDPASVTQFGTTSNIVLSTQDGFPPGTLESFSIGATGIITGSYSNGLTQDVGQIAAATFANQDGLLSDGENLFKVGANSGTPAIGAPSSSGRGSLNSGFLEQSNVDLAREFSELIITQRAYQANARTITAADALLAEAVNLV